MAAPVKTSGQPQKQAPKPSDESQMAFGKTNYIGVIIGFFLVVLGFYLMVGEKFIDAKEFSKSLYVAPPVIVIGFGVIAYAIMINPGKKKDSGSDETA